MNSTRIQIVAGMFMIVAPAVSISTVLADQATDTLIAEIIRGARTDIAKASRLLDAANEADAGDLKVALLTKAVEYGVKGRSKKAYIIASQAFDRLMAEKGTGDDAWRNERIELYRRWCKTAEKSVPAIGMDLARLLVASADQHESADRWAEAAKAYSEANSIASRLGLANRKRIAAKLLLVNHLRLSARRITMLTKAMEGKAPSAASRLSLIKLLAVDMDRPAQAATYVTDQIKEPWLSCVPLAAKPVGELTQIECLKLGNWYAKDVLPRTRPLVKPRMLIRARGHLERYLELHGKRDADRLRAKLVLKTVIETMMDLGIFEVRKPRFDDKAVQAAFDKAVAYLWSQQRPDGTWPPYRDRSRRARYQYGPSILAVRALLASGIHPDDPRIVKTLEVLAQHKSETTYIASMQCDIWLVVGRTAAGRYAREMRRDVAALVTSTGAGGYTYTMPRHTNSSRDNSNSQYGLMGVAAGAESGLKIPKKYWLVTLQYWLACQRADGGWGYTTARASRASTVSMTAAGLASAFICQKHLGIKTAVINDSIPMRRGYEWLNKNTPSSFSALTNNYYTLYTMSRLGVISGKRLFGDKDWFKWGSEALVKAQGANGGWQKSTRRSGTREPIVSTTLGVLFLANGARLDAY